MRRYLFLLIAIFLLLILTMPAIISGRFPFVFDMGRDMLWTRNMVELRRPTLIGPWGSIAGVYFGPLWFYLLSIPYIIFKGDPKGAVLVPLISNMAVIIIGWRFLRQNRHPAAADIFAVLFAAAPLVANISSFAFHANLLPLITLLFMIGLFNFYRSPVTVHRSLFLGLPLSALMASLAYHFEPAAGVMLTGLLSVLILINMRQMKIFQSFKSLKNILIAGFLFLLTFVPQFIFELRHDFIQTKSLAAYFQGENTSLGGVLPLEQRITERVTKLSITFSQSVFRTESAFNKWPLFLVFTVLILSLIKLKKKFKTDKFTVYCLLFTVYFILFHYLAYTFVFPAELKGWYLYGLAALYVISAALIFEHFIYHKISLLILIILIFQNINPIDRFFSKPETPAMETLAAQLEAVDWIYNDAKIAGAPFSIFTYTPPIYDYHYQYLIWWRGTKKYNFLPAEFAYLPGEKDYLQFKDMFVSKVWSPQDAKLIYLVIEPDREKDRVDGWFGHFAKYDFVRRIDFPSGVKIEVRKTNV